MAAPGPQTDILAPKLSPLGIGSPPHAVFHAILRRSGPSSRSVFEDQVALGLTRINTDDIVSSTSDLPGRMSHITLLLTLVSGKIKDIRVR